MPLIVRPAPPAPPVGPPAGSDRSSLVVTYVDPDGGVWQWSDPASGMFVTSLTGIGSPPAALSALPLPDGGELAQTFTPGKRQIVLGLYVYDDDSQAGLLNRLDALAWALWTQRAGNPAPGTLQFGRPGGTVREIDVFVTSGPEQADTSSTQDGYQWSTSFALTFVSALDPLLTDVEAVGPIVFAASTAGGVPPMPPVALSPGTTLGATTIFNDGGGDAFPIWTIQGPGTPAITNTTTGRTWSLDVPLGSAEVVTVDTRPGRQSAIDGTGASRWGDLVKSSPRDLWWLVRGRNDLNISIAGSGSGSQVSLTYQQRWLRA